MSAGDVTTAAAGDAPGLPAGVPGTDFTEVPHTNVRKIIANRLLQAKTTIPHYYLTVDLPIDDLMALREKVSVCDFRSVLLVVRTRLCVCARARFCLRVCMCMCMCVCVSVRFTRRTPAENPSTS